MNQQGFDWASALMGGTCFGSICGIQLYFQSTLLLGHSVRSKLQAAVSKTQARHLLHGTDKGCRPTCGRRSSQDRSDRSLERKRKLHKSSAIECICIYEDVWKNVYVYLINLVKFENFF